MRNKTSREMEIVISRDIYAFYENRKLHEHHIGRFLRNELQFSLIQEKWYLHSIFKKKKI